MQIFEKYNGHQNQIMFLKYFLSILLNFFLFLKNILLGYN